MCFMAADAFLVYLLAGTCARMRWYFLEEKMSESDLQRLYNLPLLEKKIIQELNEIAGIVVYDGVVDDKEVTFLKDWLDRHTEYAKKWPFTKLFRLLGQVLEDGKVDSDERLQLLMFLSGISAFTREASFMTQNPSVVFADHSFLFSGDLEIVTPDRAAEDVKRLGARVASTPDKGLDYLVVGNLGAGAWKDTKHAVVIQMVLGNIEAGADMQIISEAEFVRTIVKSTNK